MELDEAIKAMQNEVNNIPVIPHSKLHSAHLLGIEALKRLKELRLLYYDPPRELLPDETKD